MTFIDKQIDSIISNGLIEGYKIKELCTVQWAQISMYGAKKCERQIHTFKVSTHV